MASPTCFIRIVHPSGVPAQCTTRPPECIRHVGRADSSWSRFEQSGSLEDLDQAIDSQQAAVDSCCHGGIDRVMMLNGLGVFLSLRYERWGDSSHMERAISTHRIVLEQLPEGHPVRPQTIRLLALNLLWRFNSGGRMDDLDESVSLNYLALELLPEAHPDRPASLINTSNSLLMRFRQKGGAEDLEESLILCSTAVELLPNGDYHRCLPLINIAVSLYLRFRQRGRIEDLEESITLNRAALDMLPETHSLRSVSLANIAQLLWTRFQQGGRIDDLEESIALNRVALELRPEGHPERSVSLNNTALSLWTRFQHLERAEDLEESIVLNRAALALRPEGDPERSESLLNVANCLLFRFRRTGTTAYLEESITLYRAALNLLSERHPERSMSLINLAASLFTCFVRMGRTEDLEECIALNRAALETVREGHQYHPTLLNNTAAALSERSKGEGRKEDMEEAIILHRTALNLRPEGHLEHSMFLTSFAESLHIRFQEEGRADDFEESIRYLRRATAHAFSSISQRTAAVQIWITFARRYDHETLPEAHRAALSLLQLATTIRETLSARHKFLYGDGPFRSLSLDAASYAISRGDFSQAIEFLEQGRALLWSQLRGLRSPLDQLSRINRKLSKKFSVCNRRLQSLITSSEPGSLCTDIGINGSRASSASQEGRTTDEKLVQMRRLYEEQEMLIGKIRRLPGLQSFLRAPAFKDIQRVASEGPVIILNYSVYRCDALIVLSQRNDPCVCVPLDGNFYGDAARLHGEFLHVRQKCKVSSAEYDEVLRRVMKFLWDRAVSKVVRKLEELGFKEGSRIWWCPTSVLSAFPFHASGPYEDANGKTKYLLDDYISSYTPTLTSLINARCGVQSGNRKESMLFVADNRLPWAKKEKASVMRIRRFKQLVDERATPETVLKVLGKTRWVHFVCHGKLDEEEPFNSSLMLPGGRLTLLDIARSQLPNAEFAFLSACHTAGQGQKYALDEALHLAASMQFCGFRSVVGTMWQLLDRDGPFLANAVYAYLMRDLDDGGARFKGGAAAVREAALRLREFGEPDPGSGKLMAERWVNLIHIGA